MSHLENHKKQVLGKRKKQGKLFFRELQGVKMYSFGDGLECRVYRPKEKK